ncbi:hypothetical protein PCANC_26117 [Puccinia coronata f. sp. avenae]|uniref:Uncharacterized protein n=1 Tax=Puccinia coronata f. sp. avenae TaxID=200324 RepID=A0A2N5TNY2_9BASI|nr:hypothetical protein PCANC_26117 [Puccinia coronata f. sp. avenae]
MWAPLPAIVQREKRADAKVANDLLKKAKALVKTQNVQPGVTRQGKAAGTPSGNPPVQRLWLLLGPPPPGSGTAPSREGDVVEDSPPTMHNHIRSDSANPSQWDQMDARLLELHRCPIDFTCAWQELLCKKDLDLFGSSPATLDAIVKADVYCPTNNEVEARLAELGNPT